MKPSKPIKEWKYVFLDTSVIIDFLQNPERHTKNPKVQERIKRTQKLINYLGNSNNGNRCVFYISAVSLSELIKLSRPENIGQEVALIFNTSDVVFMDFTKSIANRLQKSLEHFLPDGEKHKFIKKLEKSLNEQDVYNSRQWVSDDLKIAATAESTVRKLDVLLTGDRNTFFPIAEKLEIPCLVTDDIPLDLFGELDTESTF
jgi:hypothetical protein